MGKRESGIQSRTVEMISFMFGHGAVARVKHGTAYAVVGDPDIYACVRGRFIALEIKNEDGELTKIQLQRLQEFRTAGAIVGAIRDPAEALNIINQGLRQ